MRSGKGVAVTVVRIGQWNGRGWSDVKRERGEETELNGMGMNFDKGMRLRYHS